MTLPPDPLPSPCSSRASLYPGQTTTDDHRGLATNLSHARPGHQHQRVPAKCVHKTRGRLRRQRADQRGNTRTRALLGKYLLVYVYEYLNVFHKDLG